MLGSGVCGTDPSVAGEDEDSTLRLDGLGKIAVPTLVIGARYDTMDPAYMEMMAGKLQKGRYLFCPNGGHLDMYDDQAVYTKGVIQFIRDVDAGRM
jgi:proline iminopeptidase